MTFREVWDLFSFSLLPSAAPTPHPAPTSVYWVVHLFSRAATMTYHRLWGLKKQKVDHHSGHQKSKSHDVCRSSYLQRLREILLLASPSGRWLQALLSCGCITPSSATSSPALLLCVFSSSVSYNRLSIEFRTHVDSVGDALISGSLYKFHRQRSFFSNKIMFTVSRMWVHHSNYYK